MKIFLDANIFIAAAGNEDGGSSYLFRIAEIEKWILFTNPYALMEARRNIWKKLPDSKSRFSSLIVNPTLIIANPAPKAMQDQCKKIVPEKDAPILAGALFSKSNILCTLDQQDFHNQFVKTFCKSKNLIIKTPKQMLKMYRRHGSMIV